MTDQTNVVLAWLAGALSTVWLSTHPWATTGAAFGWKIMTDKFGRYGFAQLVNTFNPLDGYGDD